MVERERGVDRTAEQHEPVVHLNGSRAADARPLAGTAAEETEFQRQMAIGIGVQHDFEEALAVLAK